MFSDHSALTYILNSKRPVVTNRLERLVRALNRFNFSIYYLPGQKMHVADVLSRLAGRDIDPPDKVIPISFNALKNLPPRRTLPQRTRQPPHQQLFTIDKLKPSQIPSCYKPQQAQSLQTQKTTQTTTRSDKRSTSLPSCSRRQKDTHFPLTPPISQSNIDTPINISQVPDDHTLFSPSTSVTLSTPIVNRPIMHKPNLQRTLFSPIPPRSQSLLPKPPPAPQTPDTSTPPCTTLNNPLLDIPHTLPPVDLPPPQQESLETYRPPEKYLYCKPLPVLQHSSNLNLFTRHIPKQKDIEDFLKILRAKVLHSYSLPLLASEIQQAYKTSSAFKNIYQYITTNMLPSNKRLQRSVISNAENYIVADGLLFRLYETYRNKQLIRRCLLVIPEMYEHVIFQHYHDSLLGAHYGPLNTFYTIQDKYYIHNLFDKINKYVSSCNECQKQ